MKIALLVFPLHYSHGCILQTYALYSKLKEIGHDITIIDRQPNKQPTLRWCLTVGKRMARRIFKGYKGAVLYRGWFPKTIMKEQQSFIDGFKEDITTVYSTEELRQVVASGGYEAIVVGSDQTWRPCYLPNVMDYWLEFTSDIPIIKVAYAPSFGVDKWEYDEDLTTRCKKLACLFKGLSVREESGVKLCKEYLDAQAKHVLDPTLLWDRKFYTPIAKKSPAKTGCCQCYFLDKSPEKVAIAEEVARKLNLELNYINTRTEDVDAPLNERIAPSIEKWLAGFLYGDFIVVDSFHAMVFSIIFQKPFIVIGNKQRGLSRFESLLSKMGLKDRLLTDSGRVDSITSQKINWVVVDGELNKLRTESIAFIREALS